jgi:hypothetical protein
MAHEVRTQSDAVWVNGYVVPRSDWESLEGKSFRSINGVEGGCWAPSAPIILTGGVGTIFEVTGLTQVKGFGNLELGGAAGITLADNDFPELLEGHVGREREILQSMLPYMTVGSYPWAVGVNRKYASAQPLALTLKDSQGVESTPEFLIPLRVHDGATLDQVTFSFRVPSGRTRAPVSMPKFRVFRVDKNGVTSELKSVPLQDGFDSPKNPGSSDAWYAAGAAQSFTYVCDQNNVIDISIFRYFAHVVEEGGATEYPGRLEVFTAAPIRRISNVAYDLSATNEDDHIDGVAFYLTGPNKPICILKDQINRNPLTRGVLSGGLSRVRRASRWCAVSIASSTTRA